MEAWKPETTPNFSEEEFRCKCGKCGGALFMRQDFMEALQQIRSDFNRPMVVNSGYRCRQHPEELRKSSPGAHAQGRAADIAVSTAGDRFLLARIGMVYGMTGIGVAKTFIHLDNGHENAGRPAIWSY